jgi:hypothetical protein
MLLATSQDAILFMERGSCLRWLTGPGKHGPARYCSPLHSITLTKEARVQCALDDRAWQAVLVNSKDDIYPRTLVQSALVERYRGLVSGLLECFHRISQLCEASSCATYGINVKALRFEVHATAVTGQVG